LRAAGFAFFFATAALGRLRAATLRDRFAWTFLADRLLTGLRRDFFFFAIRMSSCCNSSNATLTCAGWSTVGARSMQL
jgi:hypothetical protein